MTQPDPRQELPLPPLLKELIALKRWKHPGDDVLKALIPFIREDLVFLETKPVMVSESGPLMGPDEVE